MIQGADSPLILCTITNKYMKISEIIDAISSEIVARGLYLVEVTVSKDNDVEVTKTALPSADSSRPSLTERQRTMPSQSHQQALTSRSRCSSSSRRLSERRLRFSSRAARRWWPCSKPQIRKASPSNTPRRRRLRERKRRRSWSMWTVSPWTRSTQ